MRHNLGKLNSWFICKDNKKNSTKIYSALKINLFKLKVNSINIGY